MFAIGDKIHRSGAESKDKGIKGSRVAARLGPVCFLKRKHGVEDLGDEPLLIGFLQLAGIYFFDL